MSVRHEIEPVYDKNSRILILGSFPSVKSREAGFFYGHPRNRFWRVLAGIFGEAVPQTTEEKKEFLLRNRIAVWDVIAECDITGSSDSSICNVRPTDIRQILTVANIERICCNGATAYRLYEKYLFPVCKRDAVKLPSSSPANASWSEERLQKEWERWIS